MQITMQGTMWYRIAGVVAVTGFAIMMALRGELSSIAARTVLAAIAGSLVGVAWICFARSRTDRRLERS